MLRALTVILLVMAAAVVAACGSAADDAPVVRATSPSTSETSADGLISGGTDEFRRRLEGLRGRPVIVNQWASWCPPCREEFPLFQQAAKAHAGKVAFLGVDSGDESASAERFLREHPTPYPHLEDRKLDIARSFGGGRSWPTTVFYGPDGHQRHIAVGGYPSQELLEHDIQEYAIDG